MQRCWEGEDTRLGRIVSIRKPILSWSYTGVNKMVRWHRIQKRPGKKKTEHFSVHLSGFSVGGHPLPLVPVRALPGASVAAAACGHCPRAEPAPREMREPQPLLLDSEDPSAWQCPQERSERTIRAGAAPSPVTAGRSAR